MSKVFKNMPPQQWPDFIVKWDESKANLHYYADGEDATYIKLNYPHGISIADISLVSLDDSLCFTSRQSPSEFWTVGCADKKIEVIEHWVSGGKITPCMVRPFNGQIFIAGGNHRLAVARVKKEMTVPVLFDTGELDEIKNIIPIFNVRVPI
ncbi:hypothetical protein [Aeromonas dhakensis]|uniref:hypothetical protein n=1 Tax=Aeromonas dhakensis TaxID=196024 RepID=UPI003BA399CD